MFFRIYSKVNLVIYLSLPFNSPRFKALAATVFELYFADKVKCPKLQRAITHEVFFRMYSKVNPVIYSSLPIYSSSFKGLAAIIFQIIADKRKIPKLQRAITHEIFFQIYSKVKQVNYSSPINSPSFKALAPTVIEIFC